MLASRGALCTVALLAVSLRNLFAQGSQPAQPVDPTAQAPANPAPATPPTFPTSKTKAQRDRPDVRGLHGNNCQRWRCHRPCKRRNKGDCHYGYRSHLQYGSDEQTAEFKSQYGSQRYYFCSEECKGQFELRPEQYARVGIRPRELITTPEKGSKQALTPIHDDVILNSSLIITSTRAEDAVVCRGHKSLYENRLLSCQAEHPIL
jgi:YHS domain-containing protein